MTAEFACVLTHLFARRHEANHSTIGDYSRGKWVGGSIAGNTQANGGRGVRHVRFWAESRLILSV